MLKPAIEGMVEIEDELELGFTDCPAIFDMGVICKGLTWEGSNLIDRNGEGNFIMGWAKCN